ncbi:hypothetical protein SASPL_115992 [Salvia splendens]|uniref:Uncharacterized protein n=1 Tax=Salvia splendens TaxID=180675 RepID=A0A8X8Y9D0_SALSN|nr:hypothetical protein SASPL_115992 [Salvia splendens]
MEATRSPQFLPPKSIITQFDAPNSPPQNPIHQLGFPIPAPPLRLLFWKSLTRTDATNHLYINDRFRPGLMAALTAAERRRVETDFLEVPATMDERIGDNATYKLRLKRTPLRGEMLLQREWKDLAMRNGLVDGDGVAGYGYRNHLGQFCLIFSVVKGE